MAAIFPQVAFKRCIRQQLPAVRRRAGDLKKFVASMVSFTSHAVNPFLVMWTGRRSCENLSKRGTENRSPDKISSKTSSLVSVAGFPGTVPVTVPGWFLLLLSPVPVTTF